MKKRLCLFLIFILLFLSGSFLHAQAQIEDNASISLLDSSSFPTIQFFLDIHSMDGRFVHNLSESQVAIIENGKSLPVSHLLEIKPGVQFVLAINPGPSFAIRNSQAISRYDLIRQALSNWAQARVGTDIDDLSLIINNGPELSHVGDYEYWKKTFESAEFDARNAVPSLDGLFKAVTVANDATPRPGMERAILFITPAIESKEIETLNNLISQVQQQNVSIHIWLVSSAGGFQTVGVQKLMDLANTTGGTFFAFSGEENIPDPETFLQELRNIYQVSYQSAISSGGIHQVFARIETGPGAIETPPQTIEVDLQPVQPTFVSPPIRIQRQPIEANETSEAEDNKDTLQPGEQAIQVVFDFPDGRIRPILSSSLLVDGVIVAENKQPPFDSFTWDISQIETPGTYTLQVQATDSLNITGASLAIPVYMSIQEISNDPWEIIRKNTPILIGLAVFISGSILILVLILGGRLRPRAVRVAQTRRRKQDPVTQPVPIDSDLDPKSRSDWINRFQRNPERAPKKTLAYLSPLSEAAQADNSQLIKIYEQETLVGSDAKQAHLLLEDPSIEKVHARLVLSDKGTFRILDTGSIAGTWVNYTPVSQIGLELEHGDIIHFGRIGFRFTLRQPKNVRRVVVTPLSEDQSPNLGAKPGSVHTDAEETGPTDGQDDLDK